MNFLAQRFLGNTVEDYLIAIGIFIGLWIVLKLFQAIIIKRLRRLADKTETDIDNVLVEIIASIKPSFYFLASVWGAFQFIYLGRLANQLVNIAIIVVLTYQIIIALQVLIDYLVSKKVEDENSKSAIQLIGKITKFVLWSIGILMLLSNLGVNINSLLAGMGIGGIAIALALQNILGELFSSLAIYLDKPFVVGDFIIVGDDVGTVEKIGIKTTRVRSPQGEEIVISNKELTTVRVHNLRRMTNRRVLINVGVTYSTSDEKMKLIPKIFEEIIKNTDKTEFGRAHFKGFGDSALLFELVYFINDRDYDLFMDINQQVQLALKEKFESAKIDFAYPSQTIYLEK